jgi:hypothetical protein
MRRVLWAILFELAMTERHRMRLLLGLSVSASVAAAAT